MRATTHVDGKAIRSSRAGSTGRRLPRLRTTMAPLAGRRYRAADCVAAGVGGPSFSHRARMPGWTSRWGRGPLGHAQDDQDVRPWPPVCARFRWRLRSSARARTARSPCRPERGRRPESRLRRSLVGQSERNGRRALRRVARLVARLGVLAVSGVARIGAGMSAAPAMTRQNARKRAVMARGPEPIGSGRRGCRR